MKVALVHDWLNGMRGGEKVLEVLCELYPDADIFTLLLEREKVSRPISGMNIRTSFIQNLPLAAKKYRSYLPLFPRAVESFDLRGYDLVISTSHAVAKGCRPPQEAVNICYCFTPMRYIWFLYEDYFGCGVVKKAFLSPFLAYLRRWDVASSRRVDRFLAISKNVAERIRQIYNNAAEVVYPPVDTDFFSPGDDDGDFFLVVSALVPYKRVDLAVAAFNRLGLPLKVIGTGPSAEKLKKEAGEGIEFLGWRSDEELREYYRRCRALIFGGVEDFGIVPLEAQACGRPVIGLGRGGLLETTVSGSTGVFFYEQNVESLIGGVKSFLDREKEFNREAIREHSLKFDRRIFKEKIHAAIEKVCKESSK